MSDWRRAAAPQRLTAGALTLPRLWQVCSCMRRLRRVVCDVLLPGCSLVAGPALPPPCRSVEWRSPSGAVAGAVLQGKGVGLCAWSARCVLLRRGIIHQLAPGTLGSAASGVGRHGALAALRAAPPLGPGLLCSPIAAALSIAALPLHPTRVAKPSAPSKQAHRSRPSSPAPSGRRHVRPRTRRARWRRQVRPGQPGRAGRPGARPGAGLGARRGARRGAEARSARQRAMSSRGFARGRSGALDWRPASARALPASCVLARTAWTTPRKPGGASQPS